MQEEMLLDQVEEELEAGFDFNVTLTKASLFKALSHVQSVVEKKNIVPILANIKLSAKANILEIVATDLDILISEKVTAAVGRGGELTVHTQTFYDIVRKLPDDSDINISLNQKSRGKLDIVSGNCNFSISYLEADDYPVMEQGEMLYNFTIGKEDLCRIIDKTKFSISADEGRYNLNGIFFHITSDGKFCKAVSTDGHRLSCAWAATPEGAETIPGVIIPRKAILELRKITEDINDVVSISLSQRKIKFTFANSFLITKLIDGNFPEYDNLIPKETEFSVVFSKAELKDAVDRVSTLSSEKTKGVKITINKQFTKIDAMNENNGVAEEMISCASSLENMVIGLNSKYLLDILAVCNGQKIEFCLNDTFSPILIKDIDDSMSEFIVMPMRA